MLFVQVMLYIMKFFSAQQTAATFAEAIRGVPGTFGSAGKSVGSSAAADHPPSASLPQAVFEGASSGMLNSDFFP